MRWAVALFITVAARNATASPETWWVSPLERIAATTRLIDEAARPYDTPLHPRAIAGELALSCEHGEGRPCGDGVLAFGELDSRAGYGHWMQVASRLRAQAGTRIDDTIAIDRAHLDLELSSIAAEIGRDVVRIGPSSRTHLSWGDNAPPLDHVRLSTAKPWRLGSDDVHGSATYLVGRLRAPQRFPGTLVTIGRGQIDVGSSMSVGVVQMLQLEGEGARHLGLVDFILEHVRRKDISAGETDSSNRRFGGDVSIRIRELANLRLYYVFVFEDIRAARFIDAVRYDADHLFGAELSAVSIEYHQTAARSQEHSSRTTGFTHGGFAVGSPLGPDARSIYVQGNVVVRRVHAMPWIEHVQLRNRMLQYVDQGPITPVAEGQDESRYRFGMRADITLRADLQLDGDVFLEHVDDFAFEPRATRNNAGLSTALVWTPGL